MICILIIYSSYIVPILYSYGSVDFNSDLMILSYGYIPMLMLFIQGRMNGGDRVICREAN